MVFGLARQMNGITMLENPKDWKIFACTAEYFKLLCFNIGLKCFSSMNSGF